MGASRRPAMATPFRPAVDLLADYAAYHRDRRNIATHFVGVPMIVFSVVLALTPFAVGGVNVALIALFIAAVYYVILDVALGTAMLIFLFVCYLVSIYLTASIAHTGMVLGVALLLFVVGWIIQFIGHWYEGRKPAFVDDIVGLLVGPMFVTAEALFSLGWGKPLLHEIERRVGPTMKRDLARIA